MFANIRRHQKWLWILISGAVIISFVWYFNPNTRYGNRGAVNFSAAVGSVNGRSISRSEYLQIQNEAQIRHRFVYGSWFGEDEFSRRNHPEFLSNEIRN